jgi:hypothetical protein
VKLDFGVPMQAPTSVVPPPEKGGTAAGA